VHLDLGGGSLELTHFRNRLPLRSWSLPLGALLLNDRFLADDPPSPSQIASLQAHVRQELQGHGLRPLKAHERLVATGGTVRSLAKLDRDEHRYPLPQIHGYSLTRRRIKELSRRLAQLQRQELAEIRGLNPDRKDSIVAGALAMHTVLRVLGADEAQVSGQGLREGYALSTCLRLLPPARSVRRVAVEALARRFATWDLRAAQRRSALAAALQAILDREASQEMQETLLHAAWIIDIGKCIDYVDRLEHAAAVLMATDLAGFGHRRLALLAATVEAADRRRPDWRNYRPLLSEADERPLEKSGLLLALADEIERRLPPESGIPVAFHDVHRAHIGVDLPAPYGGRLAALAGRFSQVFGWELHFQGRE
jgi:exopolyphosphatase/guanosine-5'-triphosphate,3'-diphosphate pyrophosphatase